MDTVPNNTLSDGYWSTMEKVDVVRTAIVDRRRLSFTYRGRPRIVNPVRIGVSAGGDWLLRAIQVGGESRTGRYGGSAPKLFRVAQMEGVEVLDAEFQIPRQYRRGDTAFVRITSEL